MSKRVSSAFAISKKRLASKERSNGKTVSFQNSTGLSRADITTEIDNLTRVKGYQVKKKYLGTCMSRFFPNSKSTTKCDTSINGTVIHSESDSDSEEGEPEN